MVIAPSPFRMEECQWRSCLGEVFLPFGKKSRLKLLVVTEDRAFSVSCRSCVEDDEEGECSEQIGSGKLERQTASPFNDIDPGGVVEMPGEVERTGRINGMDNSKEGKYSGDR